MAKKSGSGGLTRSKRGGAKKPRPASKDGVKKTRRVSKAKKVVRKKSASRRKQAVKKVHRKLAPLTIVTIVFAVHDYAEIVASPNAPYFNQLIAQYGLAPFADASPATPYVI